MTTYTVTMPGAFDSWFSGSSVAQGQTGGDAGMESLHAAYRSAERRRVGRRGYMLTMLMDAEALDRLQEYAETAAECNGAEAHECKDARRDYRAALDMLARINKARVAKEAA